MPESFDPAWEYFVPDPEIAWIFARSGAYERFEGIGDHIGLRFGKGNPDKFWGKLAPEKPIKKRWVKEKTPQKKRVFLTKRNCVRCGVEYKPDHSCQKYCSYACCGQIGAAASSLKDRERFLSVSSQFISWWNEGKKLKDIASLLGIAIKTVGKWRRRLLLPARIDRSNG